MASTHSPARRSAGRPDLDHRQLVRVDLDHRHVGARIHADHLGGELAPVGGLDRDLGGVAHHVGVGQDDAVGADGSPSPGRAWAPRAAPAARPCWKRRKNSKNGSLPNGSSRRPPAVGASSPSASADAGPAGDADVHHGRPVLGRDAAEVGRGDDGRGRAGHGLRERWRGRGRGDAACAPRRCSIATPPPPITPAVSGQGPDGCCGGGVRVMATPWGNSGTCSDGGCRPLGQSYRGAADVSARVRRHACGAFKRATSARRGKVDARAQGRPAWARRPADVAWWRLRDRPARWPARPLPAPRAWPPARSDRTPARSAGGMPGPLS